MRILVAGTGRLGVSAMTPLLDSRHEIVGLLRNGRATRGWRRKFTVLTAPLLHTSESPLLLARKHAIPILWLDQLDEEGLAPLEKLKPDLILACGFSIIFKRPLLELPRIGCVNVHSSLLPRHRGPNPFSHVILADETTSGITFHVMDEGIDTGDILYQAAFPVSQTDTAVTVYYRACDLARRHVFEVLDRIDSNGLEGIPQDPADATYDRKLKPADFRLDWRKRASELERLVRAGSPFHNAWFEHNGGRYLVLKARCEPSALALPGTVLRRGEQLGVATAEGILVIEAATAATVRGWFKSLWRPPRPGDVLD